jgi:glucose/arabinose dehydrogenase
MLRVCILVLYGSSIGSAMSIASSPLFNVTQFATGLSLPDQMVQLSDGSIAIQTSPFGATGQILRFTDANHDGIADGAGTLLYQTASGPLTGLIQVGNYYAVGNYGDHTITLLKPGATADAPMTAVATLQFTYPADYEHDTIGLASRPTPGSSGSYDLVFNIGAQGNDTSTTTHVQLSGLSTASLDGDSLYSIVIDETGASPTASTPRKIVQGIRNISGMQFDAAGNLYFADNAIDGPGPTGDEPPQADELNLLAASDFGVTVLDYGYPNCYVEYRTGATVGSGCVLPLVAFQPLPNGTPLGAESEGPAGLAFAPAEFPAGFNNGIFIGFYGKHVNGTANEENAVVYYDLATHSYLHFVESGQADMGHLDSFLAMGNALYMADFGTGVVYQITAAAPEPGTAGLLLAALLLVAGSRLRR